MDETASPSNRLSFASPPRKIRDFAAQHVAPFKVPRKIVLLDDLPKGPTGKLQRIGLAERLGFRVGPPLLLPHHDHRIDTSGPLCG